MINEFIPSDIESRVHQLKATFRFNFLLYFGDVMFKLISCLVAGAVVLAPMLPAQAGYHRIRSSGFGVQVGSPSFGFSVGNYNDRYRRYPNEVIIRRSFYDRDRSYYPGVNSPGFYSPGFPNSTVIVVPRTVILNPGYNNYNYRNYNQRNYNNHANCGSVIYGSPIASPIPVDPFTGLACR